MDDATNGARAQHDRLQAIAYEAQCAAVALLTHLHSQTEDLGGLEGQKIVQGMLGAALWYALTNTRRADDAFIAAMFHREIDLLIPQLRFAIDHPGPEGMA